MNKIIPADANLIPADAKKVFGGKIFEVWQWPQKMYDGSTDTFEMLKRPDTVVVVAVKDEEIVITRQSQPNREEEFMDFPGGRADEGEMPLESAKREMLEETGMKFNHWKLIDVIQPYMKMEWFIYTFLATDFQEQTDTAHDAGEKIELASMKFEDLKNIDVNLVRFDRGIYKKYASLQDLLNAPEYKGVEYPKLQ